MVEEMKVAQNNVMRYKGDIRTYGYAGDDGSTVGVSRLAIGEKGSLLKVTEDNKLFYETLDEITKVYYVLVDGVDVPKTEETKQHPENNKVCITIFTR